MAETTRTIPIQVVARYSIPYDLDDMLWDEGCGGTDLWEDECGETLALLVSDTGSAYVCPENMPTWARWGFYNHKWSLYMEPSGKAWRMEQKLVPAGSKAVRKYEHSDASEEFEDILACYENHGVSDSTFEDIRDRFTYNQDNEPGPLFPSTLSGAEVYLSAKNFGAENCLLSLKDDLIKIAIEDPVYLYYFIPAMNSGPLAGEIAQVCYNYSPDMLNDSIGEAIEIAEACGSWPHMFEPVDQDKLQEIISGLRAEIEDTRESDSKRDILDIAIRNFERAYRTAAEIEVFENECCPE